MSRTSAAPCWICGHDPHEPTDLHAYTTEAEAYAWAAAQPSSAPVWPVIDGEPLGGHP